MVSVVSAVTDNLDLNLHIFHINHWSPAVRSLWKGYFKRLWERQKMRKAENVPTLTFFFNFSQDLFVLCVLNGIIESQHVHFETNCDRREMTISAILRRVGNLRLVNCRLFSFDGRLSLKSHYETLGVSVSASKKEIREGYIKKSKVWWEKTA